MNYNLYDARCENVDVDSDKEDQDSNTYNGRQPT